MRWAYRIIRTILVSLLSLTVGIPVLIYMLLWLGPVRDYLRSEAERQLSGVLDASVSIGSLNVEPFTRLKLQRAAVAVSPEDTVMTIGELSAGVSLRDLIIRQRIVITDVELMEPSIALRRTDPQSPLNVDPIIRTLKGDGQKEPARFDLAVHTVIIRGGTFSYDVISEPFAPGKTDFNHIRVSGLNTDANAPRISRDSVSVRLRRLQFHERGGFALNRLGATVVYTPSRLTVEGLTLALPSSRLEFANAVMNLDRQYIGRIELLGGSSLSAADFKSLLPFDVSVIPSPIELSGRAELFRDSVQVNSLNLRAGRMLTLQAHGNRSEALVPRLEIESDGDQLERIIGTFAPLSAGNRSIIRALGPINLTAAASWRAKADVSIDANIESALGLLAINAAIESRRLSGDVTTPGLNLAPLAPGKQLGRAALSARFDLGVNDGSASVSIDEVEWRGHAFTDLTATATYSGREVNAAVSVNDPFVGLTALGAVNMTRGDYAAEMDLRLHHLRPDSLGLWDKKPGSTLSGNLAAQFRGPDLMKPTGSLRLTDLKLTGPEPDDCLTEKPLVLTTDFASETQSVSLQSGPLTLEADGLIDIAGLPQTVRRIAAASFPQMFPLGAEADTLRSNDFTLSATIHESTPLFDLIDMPVRPLFDIDISAMISEPADSAFIGLNMPYVQNGKKLLRDLRVNLNAGASGSLYGTVTMDNKHGRPMTFRLNSDLVGGTALTSLGWKVDSDRRFDGQLAFDIKPLPSGADVKINESEMVFNDASWIVNPAYAGVRDGSVVIGNLTIDGPGQQAVIRGVASADSSDVLTVRLDNIDLDYLFETLAVSPAVVFGGKATGTVSGRALLSPEPMLHTDDLFVRNFSYNHCVFGDARLRSAWDNETRGISLGADIDGGADSHASVNGMIYPLTQLLDISFDAHRIPAGFLQPFMATWADEVGGHASGHARLFGDFIMVDMTGDLYADDFSLKVGYTGVTYHATDSVHMRPGRIELNNIRITDPRGRHATLNGVLTHNHFLESRFDFRVSDARRLTVIDIPPTPDAIWYGTVFGSGSAAITGETGRVEISADMQTAPGSDFTFALSSAEQAAEYDFLTFRSADAATRSDSIEQAIRDRLLASQRLARNIRKKPQTDGPSAFEINIRMDVTPDARINLVMDPVAGDKITAYGAGHLDLIYESANDEMRLYGDYRINRGDYNFTLQDIILKNFSIRDGSLVAFHGDPMDASLNVSAAYQLNANLSDLDESFLHDKEVQRTNVPVQAVLNLGGELQNPEISFDLDFPTLTSDVKRKVRSIVSTDEMMNRQIIYLLALNRFYTPDYMAGATKGNELASLASGTISSQLSNILGQLSDKFSVAPSLRSDAGDFSDLEFDVALSSTLLNNRLLLNGNFGYRDKALNNNQFIGDFDIEYLLNRSGNWRLKAYNHFNDRNLYVKTALTTQGIGLVFKHDFDTLLRPRRK